MARDDVADLFSKAVSGRRFQQLWPILQRELADYDYSSFDQIKINTGCITYIEDRARGAPVAARFSRVAHAVACSIASRLRECEKVIDAAMALRVAWPAEHDPGYKDLELLAALIVEAYEARDE